MAAKWIEQVWIQQRGRTSIQVLNEYYVTVTRKLDPGMAPDDAWADVHALLAWEPQPVDHDLVLRGRDIERRHGRARGRPLANRMCPSWTTVARNLLVRWQGKLSKASFR